MYITENEGVPCKLFDSEWWFARPYSKRSQKAKNLCSQCPERLACLASTMRFETRTAATQWGVFGGLNEPERTALRTQAAASA
jgi:hypothetical protein